MLLVKEAKPVACNHERRLHVDILMNGDVYSAVPIGGINGVQQQIHECLLKRLLPDLFDGIGPKHEKTLQQRIKAIDLSGHQAYRFRTRRLSLQSSRQNPDGQPDAV